MSYLVESIIKKNMFKTTKAFVVLLSLLCISSFSYAEELNFTVPEEEQTYQYLKSLFGNIPGAIICNDEGCGGVVPQLFDIFNKGVLTIGTAIIAYVIFVTTSITASEGDFLGRRYSSFWLPLRSAAGIGILVPISSQGYSTLQIMLMKFILFGVGVANVIYDKIDKASEQYSLTMGGGISSTSNLTPISIDDAKAVTKDLFVYFIGNIHTQLVENGNSLDIFNSPETLPLTVREEKANQLTYSIETKKGTELKLNITMSNYVGGLMKQIKVDYGQSNLDIFSRGGIIGEIFSEALDFYEANIYTPNGDPNTFPDFTQDLNDALSTSSVLLDGIAQKISSLSQTYMTFSQTSKNETLSSLFAGPDLNGLGETV